MIGDVLSRRGVMLSLATLLALFAQAMPAVSSSRQFPFDQELRFDADPKRGSKRVPGLQFSASGKVDIDLWCVSGAGQAVVVDQTITIVPVAMRDNQCAPDRLKMDEELLTQLTQVKSWRWDGSLLVLVGPQPLRFRLLTN
jgi:heat shock protein HslJ